MGFKFKIIFTNIYNADYTYDVLKDLEVQGMLMSKYQKYDYLSSYITKTFNYPKYSLELGNNE